MPAAQFHSGEAPAVNLPFEPPANPGVGPVASGDVLEGSVAGLPPITLTISAAE